MSVATISGAISGLDTSSIINGLVSAESNQQTLLKNRQSTAQSAASAYSDLISAMNSLATQAQNVAKTSAWVGTTASSSSTSVSATATGSTSASITFDVTQVAASHSVISAGTVASTSDKITGGSALTITKSDGTSSSLDVGGGSLAEVVAAINNSSSGLRAAAVQVSAGQYKLQVSSSSTGAASSFTLGGLTSAMSANVLTQGADAQIRVGGTSAAAYTATSSTNTFDKLVPGLSFTVSKVESGVTVGSAVDGTAVGNQIKSLVDSANSLLSKFSSDTAWNASTKSGGPLLGASVIRNLQQQILSAVGGANAAGVSLTRDGTLSFDATKFNTAFKADPAGVAKQFGAQTSFAAASGVTGTATFRRAGDTTAAGTYGMRVTQTAQREQWQFDNLQGPPWSGHTISLTAGSTTIDYTPSDADTLNDVVSTLSTRIRAAGLAVGVAANGNTVVFTADSAGAAQAFSVTDKGTAPDVAHQVTAGRDVAGTIDGQPATGIGSILTLSSTTSKADGLAVDTNFTDADISSSGGNVGSVTYKPGLAQTLLRLATMSTDSNTGVLVTAQNTQNAQVKQLQDQIDAWDTRLADYRASLTSQFTAMETALASLKQNTSALSGLSSSSS